jgi:hypothetical protein
VSGRGETAGIVTGAAPRSKRVLVCLPPRRRASQYR